MRGWKRPGKTPPDVSDALVKSIQEGFAKVLEAQDRCPHLEWNYVPAWHEAVGNYDYRVCRFCGKQEDI